MHAPPIAAGRRAAYCQRGRAAGGVGAGHGKHPRAVFVTHGHGDHFFGAGPVLDACQRRPLKPPGSRET